MNVLPRRTTSRLANLDPRPRLQQLIMPVRGRQMDPSRGVTLNAQLWFSAVPWRPTAGWAMVAALLAGGLGSRPLPLDWKSVVLLFLLVDLCWGAIWRMAGGRDALLPVRHQSDQGDFWLPYLQPDSPAAQLAGADHTNVLAVLLRVGIPSAFLALLVASTLGLTAVMATVAVGILTALGWISLRTLQLVPFLLQSLVTITLPWWLTLSLLGVFVDPRAGLAHGVLITAWTLHVWGERRTAYAPRDLLGIGLLAGAALTIAVLLVGVRAPFGLALLIVCWLPTWIALYRGQPLRRMNLWWWLAMLISGLALGQALW